MVVCDKCGKKITYPDSYTKKTITIYSAAGAYMGHNVDLCKDCIRKLDDYRNRAESYFMINKENPIEIFDNVKYWST